MDNCIPEIMLEVLKKNGVVAIATLGKDGPHVVNTWNSYTRITDDGQQQGCRQNGPGTGFLFKGTAAFITSGPDFDATKDRFKWARTAFPRPTCQQPLMAS